MLRLAAALCVVAVVQALHAPGRSADDWRAETCGARRAGTVVLTFPSLASYDSWVDVVALALGRENVTISRDASECASVDHAPRQCWRLGPRAPQATRAPTDFVTLEVGRSLASAAPRCVVPARDRARTQPLASPDCASADWPTERALSWLRGVVPEARRVFADAMIRPSTAQRRTLATLRGREGPAGRRPQQWGRVPITTELKAEELWSRGFTGARSLAPPRTPRPTAFASRRRARRARRGLRHGPAGQAPALPARAGAQQLDEREDAG